MAVSNTVPSVLRLTLTNPTSPRALMCNAAIGNERSITFHLNNRGSSQESNNQLNEIYSIDYSNTNVLTDLLESIQTTPVLNYTRTMLAKVSTMTPCSLVINSSNENIGKCNVTNSTNIKNKNQIFPINNNMNYNKKPINEDTNGGNTSVLANNITTVTSHSTTNTINMVNSVVNGTMANLMVKRCVDNLGNKEKSDQVQMAGRKTRVKAASPTRHGPQQCQVCSKVFGNASALAKHKLTHSDERKYACVLCSKAFKRQDHLNGHMLTHRNKKPYECKAMGCGKSYCDARSLRRHIENHHNTKIVKMTTTGQPLTQLPAIPGNEAMNELNITTGNDEMKSPLGNVSLHLLNEIKKGSVDNELSHTIQSISPITGNEGLTRQQLDLISQIMQQTKQANANIFANSSKSFQRPRTWNMQTQQQQQQVQVKVSNNDPTNANGPNLGSAAITVKMEQKAVECNLCHRKFKNIPALNGHMRLHGGYVKKDAEAKKYEKKESTGPPLQTASIGVRALIEEKIISKRGKQLKKSLIIPATNLLKKRKQFDNVIDEQQQNGTNETKFNQPETNEIINNGTHCKTLLQDVVQELNSNLRRNYIPETKDATLIELLKRGTKLAVKKILDNNEPSGNDEHNKNIVHSIDSNNVAVLTSHPISTTSTFSTPEEMSVSLSVECETNTPPIGIPISQPPNDATDIFSLAYSNDNTGNSFFDTDVYNVADNAMLLQAVDSIHLFPESTNASQLDDVALNDYTLAGNGGYNEAQIFTNDIGNADQINSVLHSPLTDNLSDVTSMNRKHFTIYGCNKKTETILNETISPLPSPLAYPTPPASHEAVTQVSPFLDEVHPLPDVSSIFENKNNLRYLQTDNNGEFDKDNGSMYMTEKEKILKLKNELYNDSKIVLGVAELYKDTQCESSLISTPNLRRNTVNSLSQFNTDNLSLLDDAHHILNVGRNDSSSLSASFFTGSIPTAEEVKETLVEVLSNEINSQSFTDNGEDLYYLPVFGLQSHMMSTSDDPLLSSSPKDFSHKNNPQNYKFDFNVFTPPSSKKLKCDSDTAKKRSNSKEFETKLTETHASNELDTITSENFWHGQNTPEVMITNRRKDGIKLHKNGPFISKLKRNCRDHYTPPPILDPIRSGQGLFCSIDNSIESNDVVFDFNETNEEITKYANTSKVNIGSDFQANIPNICNTFEQQKRCDPCAELQWNPVTINNYCQLNRFVEFAKSPSSLMGGHSEEIALRALLEANGNIQVARLALLQTSPSIPNRWTSHEIELFLKGIEVYGKDFPRIANEIRTKTSSDCVQFYYIWKKLFANTKSTYLVTELHKSCCVHLTLSNETSLNHQHQTNNENRPHVCEMPDCSASFTSKAALHGHTRIHCIGRNLNTTQQNGPQLPGTINGLVPKDDYPCKVCGKVFNKIKSRSAHMKSHRPQEVESNGVGT